MHLFGHTSGPHLAHFTARHHGDGVDLHWEARNAPPLLWRVFRSEEGYAESGERGFDPSQVLVVEGPDTHVRDNGTGHANHVYYTVFARESGGAWTRQVHVRVRTGSLVHWHREGDDEPRDLDDSALTVRNEIDGAAFLEHKMRP